VGVERYILTHLEKRDHQQQALSMFQNKKNGMHLESKHWMEDCSSNLNDESLSNLRDQAYVYTVQTINETTLIPCFGELGRTGVEMQILK